MEQDLVSIISPCYNGESYIKRFFDSVLIQTYKNIELIFIDDGSTDKTKEIALSYKKPLEDRGVKFTYVYQENKGQAAAVNTGLALFKGDFLTWPDSDDFMTANAIERKVEFLKSHDEYGLVLNKTAVVKESNPDEVIFHYFKEDLQNNNIFDNLIDCTDIYFAPIGYMVKSSCFLKALPSRKICESKIGQNWQMLLPITYFYKCGFLDEVLGYYIIRETSHSRMDKSRDDWHLKYTRQKETLYETIKNIDMKEGDEEKYLKRVDENFDKKFADLEKEIPSSYLVPKNYVYKK